MIENIPDKYIGYTGIQLCLATIHPVLNSPSNNKGKRGENKIWGGGVEHFPVYGKERGEEEEILDLDHF